MSTYSPSWDYVIENIFENWMKLATNPKFMLLTISIMLCYGNLIALLACIKFIIKPYQKMIPVALID